MRTLVRLRVRARARVRVRARVMADFRARVRFGVRVRARANPNPNPNQPEPVHLWQQLGRLLDVGLRALMAHLPRVKRTDVMGFRARPAPRDVLPWGVNPSSVEAFSLM